MSRVHIALPVADLNASVAFYTALFGEGPDKTRDGFARFAPGLAPVSLSLTHMGGPITIPEDLTHFGVRAETNTVVTEAIGRLESAGLVDLVETAEVCCHATQDKVWAVDPDGRRWEVYVITDDNPADSASNSSCCVAPEPEPEAEEADCCAPKAPSCCG